MTNLKLNVITCVLSMLAFIGQLVSTYYPRWWTVETEVGNVTETAHFGVWVTVDCLNTVCTDELSNAKGDKAWIEGMKVIEIFGVIFMFAAIIVSALSVVWQKHEDRLPLLNKLFTAFSGAAGTVVVMGVLIFYKKKAGLSPSQAIATKNGSADWCLIVSSISGVLSVVCAFLIGCKLLVNESDIDDETDYSQWYENQKHSEGNKSSESIKKLEFQKF